VEVIMNGIIELVTVALLIVLTVITAVTVPATAEKHLVAVRIAALIMIMMVTMPMTLMMPWMIVMITTNSLVLEGMRFAGEVLMRIVMERLTALTCLNVLKRVLVRVVIIRMSVTQIPAMRTMIVKILTVMGLKSVLIGLETAEQMVRIAASLSVHMKRIKIVKPVLNFSWVLVTRIISCL